MSINSAFIERAECCVMRFGSKSSHMSLTLKSKDLRVFSAASLPPDMMIVGACWSAKLSNRPWCGEVSWPLSSDKSDNAELLTLDRFYSSEMSVLTS